MSFDLKQECGRINYNILYYYHSTDFFPLLFPLTAGFLCVKNTLCSFVTFQALKDFYLAMTFVRTTPRENKNQRFISFIFLIFWHNIFDCLETVGVQTLTIFKVFCLQVILYSDWNCQVLKIKRILKHALSFINSKRAYFL